MSRDELLALAERVEKATGQDEALAVDINEALGIASYITDDGDPTASLDAAMTLVPEGWMEFDVDATAPELGIDWTLYHRKERVKATAATPALALTAAALRARASIRKPS